MKKFVRVGDVAVFLLVAACVPVVCAQQPDQQGILVYPGAGTSGKGVLYQSLADALKAAPAEALISVPSGWAETVTAPYVITKPVVIAGAPGAQITIGASNTAVFTVSGVPHVTITGFTFDGQQSSHAWTGCTAIKATGVGRLEVSGLTLRNFGLCRGIWAVGTAVNIRNSRFDAFGNGTLQVNGGSEGILIRDPIGSSSIENLEFDTFTSDNPIHIFGDSSPGKGNVRLYGIHTTNTWRNSIEIQGIQLGRIEVLHSILENLRTAGYFCLTGSTLNLAGALPASVGLGVVVDGVTCTQGSYVTAGVGIEFFSDYGTITNSQVTGFAQSVSFGGHHFKIVNNSFIAPASACIVENYNFPVDHAVIQGNTCSEPQTTGIRLGAGGPPGDAAGDRVVDNHINRTPGFWPGDSATATFCSIVLATATSPVRITGNELSIEAAPVPGSFGWQGGICHSVNSPGSVYSGNTFWNKTGSPFGTAFWASGPAYQNEEMSDNTYINLAAVGNYGAGAAINFRDNRSLPAAALPWASNALYVPGNLASQGGTIYYALVRSGPEQPDQNRFFGWSSTTGSSAPWSKTAVYRSGTTVMFGGQNWVSKGTSGPRIPPDPAYWRSVTSNPASDWTVTPVTFAKLGGALNGTSNYCSDCSVNNGRVSGGGQGAWVVLVNGSWTGLAPAR